VEHLTPASPTPSPHSPPGGLERIRTILVEDYDDIGRRVACRIAEVIRAKTARGGQAVLGLATGSTPIGVYRELIRKADDRFDTHLARLKRGRT